MVCARASVFVCLFMCVSQQSGQMLFKLVMFWLKQIFMNMIVLFIRENVYKKQWPTYNNLIIEITVIKSFFLFFIYSPQKKSFSPFLFSSKCLFMINYSNRLLIGIKLFFSQLHSFVFNDFFFTSILTTFPYFQIRFHHRCY